METDDMSLRVASFSYYLDSANSNSAHKVSTQENTKLSHPIINPPPFNIKFCKPKHKNSNTTLASKNLLPDPFSYLTPSGDNFLFEIPTPVVDPTSAFTFPNHTLPKDVGGEIGVFNADKYFNMKLEYKTEPKAKQESQVSTNPTRVATNAKAKTPSSCSEASSWNSQAALMPDFRRVCSQKAKKASGRRFFTRFGCKGPCFDKDSVVFLSPNKLAQNGLERIHINNPNQSNQTGDDNHPLKIEPLDEPRQSIEVFGSKNTSKTHDIATDMERKLSMLTWDAIPARGKTSTNYSSSVIISDDMASEASSDLFEIDNISGSVNVTPGLALADEASACMSPNSHYAPSEASIQWSVITASAADYSVVSDCNDEMSVSMAGDLNKALKRHQGGVHKGRTSGLLGCKSQKSVDVAEKIVGPKSCRVQKPKHDRETEVVGNSGRVKDVNNRLKLTGSLGNGGLPLQQAGIL